MHAVLDIFSSDHKPMRFGLLFVVMVIQKSTIQSKVWLGMVHLQCVIALEHSLMMNYAKHSHFMYTMSHHRCI